MFNIFGALGALGRFLPGYIQGREQAISSNWNDMNQYNNVQRGQLANAFHELIFPLDYNRAIDDASISRDMAQTSQLNLAQNMALFPQRMAVAAQQAQNTLSGNMNPGGAGGGGGADPFAQQVALFRSMGWTDEQIAQWKQNMNLGFQRSAEAWANGGQRQQVNPAPTEANMPTAAQLN